MSKAYMHIFAEHSASMNAKPVEVEGSYTKAYEGENSDCCFMISTDSSSLYLYLGGIENAIKFRDDIAKVVAEMEAKAAASNPPATPVAANYFVLE